MTVSTSFTLITGALCYLGMRSLYLIPRLIPKKPRKSHDGFEGHDGHDGYDGLTRFFTPRQAKKSSIFQENFLVADTRVQVVLGMHSSLSAAQIYGLQRYLFGQRIRLQTTKRVEIFGPEELGAVDQNF